VWLKTPIILPPSTELPSNSEMLWVHYNNKMRDFICNIAFFQKEHIELPNEVRICIIVLKNLQWIKLQIISSLMIIEHVDESFNTLWRYLQRPLEDRNHSMKQIYFWVSENHTLRKFATFSETRTFSWSCLKDSSVGPYVNGNVSEPNTMHKLFEDPL